MVWIIGLFVVWVVLYPATDYFVRWFAPGIVRSGMQAGKKIHLSFDDGPDLHYTPKLLHILSEFEVTASFFLVGQKVQRAPELVGQIVAAGHEVGSHTYYHWHAYWMFFRKSSVTVDENTKVLTSLLKSPLIWFRPPWGALNLFEWFAVKKAGLRPVLWTANAQDWLLESTPELILARLQRRVKPGAIILLHDSGGETGAPAQMLEALPQIIGHFKAQGYQFVSLQEIVGG